MGYSQFEEDGTDIEDVCETLAMRSKALHAAAKMAEVVMSKNIYPKPGVCKDHPWSIFMKLRDELSQ